MEEAIVTLFDRLFKEWVIDPEQLASYNGGENRMIKGLF
jgi:hypothetical protein